MYLIIWGYKIKYVIFLRIQNYKNEHTSTRYWQYEQRGN
jgi:hypothetical protein